MNHHPPLKQRIFLDALSQKPTPYTPVWLMRQAGRYLPEYRATRQRAGSFLTLAKTPELACEVTLQPLKRFDLDAAILFSDILTIPDAMGLGLHFVESEGPRFSKPLTDEHAISQLPEVDLSQLEYVFAAVKLIRQALDGGVPLIGFAGSPWTLAAYMIEGRASNDGFSSARKLVYARPDLLHHVLQINTRAVIAYLNAQVAAGAQALMIFDTWGGLLAENTFKTFSLSYIAEICSKVKRLTPAGEDIPIIVFSKGCMALLPELANCGCDALGIDSGIALSQAFATTQKRVALQGNLDPLALFTHPQQLKQAVHDLIDQIPKTTNGYVFNLGHGVLPQTDPDQVALLVNEVHTYSKARAL